MFYMLMHEDKELALFVVEGDSISNIRINSNNIKYLPLGIKSDNELKKWIILRGIPVTRKNISSDLRKVGVSSTFELMLTNCGLSLTDHYWIKPLESSYTWGSINLYTNYFKSIYSLDLQDDIKSIAGKTDFIPSASLKGDLKKKWIIDENGIRRLVKGNYNNTCRQSLSEVLATKIHRRQNKFNYTPYSLIKISSNNQDIIGCECPNFTNINTEFIPAIEIVECFNKPNNMSYYEFYIQLCLKNGLDIRYFMEYQILTDFIISNSDRHLNNFGIIRSSNTLQWLSYAPIFDSGNSMFYNSSYIPTDRALLNLEVTSFLKSEVELLKYVTNRGLINLSLLPDDNYLYSLLNKDINTREEVIERIIMAYNKKIKYLYDFQNGCNIWSYKYKK